LPSDEDLIKLEEHKELSDSFKIPASFWTKLAQDASSFFGCQDNRDVDEKLETFGERSLSALIL
jgi:hypothetical protein